MIARGSAVLALIAVALIAGTAVNAQPAAKGDQSGGAFQGVQLNRDQPVKIEANTLEVRDKQRQATFVGKVKLTQGDMILNCDTLVIFYEDPNAAPPAAQKTAPAQKKGAPAPVAAAPAPAAAGATGLGGGNQQIKRAEAKGNVLVTQLDQTAKGDVGIFDVKSNNITLTGSVVVTKGTNVLRGERMVVDLTTGVARVESVGTQRVEGLFNPSVPPPGAAPAPAATPPAAAAKAPPPAAKAPATKSPGIAPAAKSQPGAPTRIN